MCIERCHVFKLLCRNLPCLLLIVFILIQSVDADAVSVPEKTNTLHGSTFFKETSFVSHLENDVRKFRLPFLFYNQIDLETQYV